MADEKLTDEAEKARKQLIEAAREAGAAHETAPHKRADAAQSGDSEGRKLVENQSADKPTSARGESGKPAGKYASFGKPAGKYGSFGKPAGEHGGYGKPAGERRFGKPAGEHGFGKSAGERGNFGKPAGEHGFGKSAGERGNFGKPAGERRFGKPAGEHGFGKPAGERGNFGKPAGEHDFGKPAGERGNFGKPAGERRFGKPAGEHSFGKSAGERGNFGKPAGEHGKFDKTAGERGFIKPAFAARAQNGASAKPSEGTPSRRAAYQALELVLRENAYSGLALDRVLLNNRISGPDRTLATEIFYGTLENIRKIDYLLKQLLAQEPEPAVMDVLRISIYQLTNLTRVPESAVCDEAVNLTRALGYERVTGMVNGVLRNFLRKRAELKLPKREDGLIEYLSIMYSMPDFVCEKIVAQYGEEAAEKILAYQGGRYIVLRPNTLRVSEAEFERALDQNKLKWERSRVPGAYRVTGLGAIEKNGLYKQGIFSVQGESSLLCAQVLDAKPGMRVLDACAAPGGKSAALIEMMQDSGRVYSCDVHEHRVELIRAMVARLGHDGIKPKLMDATQFDPEFDGAMDAVLCDAPCSGLGVVSGKPDIKLTITPEKLAELPKLQYAILENCARYVRSGGALVYSTCTILRSENQDVVLKFLQAHPEFELDDAAKYAPECFAGAADGGMLALINYIDDMDGFFIARMTRKAAR